ncbi:glycosyltransferase [Pacificoceanicola onchidii]|uniref:glycosyltransferase n=1 Tax=Pacificoceanicola onchidii TaxID=2562685 RepID=UPI0014560C51|nr:glycosyltransferase [Pacificoceanicola onchidii]
MSQSRLIFLWNNFGPMHADRVEAVARRFPEAEVQGIELFAQDVTYDWESDSRAAFDKTTLFGAGETPGLMRRLRTLLRMGWARRRATWFLCHYERPEVFALALLLRLTGQRVFTMGCSKFDDKPRRARSEWLKSLVLRPYHGAISTERRAADYFRFLGFSKRPVASPYNTLSIARMRAQAQGADEPAFAERPWVIVARLVEKKNLRMALEAYALYRAAGGTRALEICGNGPLEASLKARAAELNIQDHVVFHGFIQTEAISKTLARSLALLLPSLEEQFGNVVIEAQALSRPVLLSETCGARELLVQDWVGGFAFPHDAPESLAGYMSLLDQDEALWARLSQGAAEAAPRGDVAAFAEAVASLVERP